MVARLCSVCTLVSVWDAAGLISLAQKIEPQCIMLSYTARRTCVVANGARQLRPIIHKPPLPHAQNSAVAWLAGDPLEAVQGKLYGIELRESSK